MSNFLIRSSLNLNQNLPPAETKAEAPATATPTDSAVANNFAPSDTIESVAEMALPSFNIEHPSNGSIDVGGSSTTMDGKITPSSDFVFSPVSADEAHAGAFFRPGEVDQDLINYLESEFAKDPWNQDTQAIFQRIQSDFSKDLHTTFEAMEKDGKLAGVISNLIHLNPYPSDQMGHLLADLISALPGDPKLRPVISTFVKMLNLPNNTGIIIKCMNYLTDSPGDLNNLPPDMLLDMSKAFSLDSSSSLESFTANRTVEIAFKMQSGQTREQATASVDKGLVTDAADLAWHDPEGFFQYFSQNPVLVGKAVSYIGSYGALYAKADFNQLMGMAVQRNFDIGALMTQLFNDYSPPAMETFDKLLTLLRLPDGQAGISTAAQSEMKQMADDYVRNMIQDVSNNYGGSAVQALGSLPASYLAKMLAILTQANDPQNQDAIQKVQAAYDIALKRG